MKLLFFAIVLLGFAQLCVADDKTSSEGMIGMKFVRISAGTFQMGSPTTEQLRFDNEARHEVRLTRAFEMASMPVTRAQFAEFVAETKYQTAAEQEGWAYGAWNAKTNAWDRLEGASWRRPGFDQQDDHPVVDVDFDDAVAFCQWMSKKSARTCRLPTEAEWEYACRAGATTAYFWGDDPADGFGRLNALDQSASQTFTLFPPFEWNDGFVHSSPAGHFRANAWGLHDMLGNVLEWCSDWFVAEYDPNPAVDPHGAADGTQRCLRGGAFVYGPKHCRCAFRGRNSPTFRNFYIGFRVVREE